MRSGQSHAARLATEITETLGSDIADPPFVSAYVAIERAQTDSKHRLDLRWSSLRERAAELGAASDTLDVVGELLASFSAEDVEDAASLAVIGDGVRTFGRAFAEPVRHDLVRVGPVPSLGPLLQSAQLDVSHVVVVADRLGADIQSFPEASIATRRVAPVREHPLHRSKPGGWSQSRFQRRAQDTWDQNAAAVAAEVESIVDDLGAELVVLAGDERAVGLVRDHLSAQVLDMTHLADAGASRDSDVSDELVDEVVRLAATVAAQRTKGVLDQFAEARSKSSASDGVDETLKALAEGRVATLLVHDDPDDERRGLVGPDPLEIASDLDAVEASDDMVPARLIDAAIRAGLGAGSDIVFVPGHGPNTPSENLGAILRF